MNQKTIATAMVLVSTVLVAAFATTSYPVAFAESKSESETETEQETDQKNVCSGWAVCTNDVESNIDSSVEDAQTLIATPN